MVWGSKRKYIEGKSADAAKVSRVISIEYLIKPENILPWINAPKMFPRTTMITESQENYDSGVSMGSLMVMTGEASIFSMCMA